MRDAIPLVDDTLKYWEYEWGYRFKDARSGPWHIVPVRSRAHIKSNRMRICRHWTPHNVRSLCGLTAKIGKWSTSQSLIPGTLVCNDCIEIYGV